ncbi:hypothetical protein, partial [Alloalcanivorax mobilis]|uniref:hypothetical protein n=1 Tax=Alloalcanivorax mobilis TaxID=2019569 RepID=UPI001E45DE36
LLSWTSKKVGRPTGRQQRWEVDQHESIPAIPRRTFLFARRSAPPWNCTRFERTNPISEKKFSPALVMAK